MSSFAVCIFFKGVVICITQHNALAERSLSTKIMFCLYSGIKTPPGKKYLCLFFVFCKGIGSWPVMHFHTEMR
jgi:hypothetical protein